MTSNKFVSEHHFFQRRKHDLWHEQCPKCNRQALHPRENRVVCHVCGYEVKVRR